jgi:transglutaminase-like putative cysteine protease
MSTVAKAPGQSLRWLRVQHETVYDYDAPVELAHHLAYLRPRSTEVQLVRQWSLSIDPAPDEWIALAHPVADAHAPASQLSVDPWGNDRLVFSHSTVHERLAVRCSFEAGLSEPSPLDPLDSPPWEAVADSLRYHAGAVRTEAVEFTLPSHFAARDPALAAFAREAFTPDRPLAEGALALMAQVHEQFDYKPLATHVGTRATEALAQRHGVCQDFAHVMIGACRSLGLAARYVSGYLLTQPPPGQPRLVGADASHAWAAVWCPTQGWLALDPTNKVQAGMDHVTLAWGRDYADVAPLRGVIRGGGRAQPRVAVTVEPVEDELTETGLAESA